MKPAISVDSEVHTHFYLALARHLYSSRGKHTLNTSCGRWNVEWRCIWTDELVGSVGADNWWGFDTKVRCDTKVKVLRVRECKSSWLMTRSDCYIISVDTGWCDDILPKHLRISIINAFTVMVLNHNKSLLKLNLIDLFQRYSINKIEWQKALLKDIRTSGICHIGIFFYESLRVIECLYEAFGKELLPPGSPMIWLCWRKRKKNDWSA